MHADVAHHPNRQADAEAGCTKSLRAMIQNRLAYKAADHLHCSEKGSAHRRGVAGENLAPGVNPAGALDPVTNEGMPGFACLACAHAIMPQDKSRHIIHKGKQTRINLSSADCSWQHFEY